MKLSNIFYGEEIAAEGLSEEETKALEKKKFTRLFLDIVLLFAWLVCLPVGAFPAYNSVFSIILLLCILVSFFDENFYI